MTRGANRHIKKQYSAIRGVFMPTRHLHHITGQPHEKSLSALKKICTRNFNIITLINLLVMSVYYLIFVSSTAYIQQKFQLSLSSAGFTSSIMVIGCLAGRFLSGNLLSFFGGRTMMGFGLLNYILSLFLFFAFDSLTMLYVIRFYTGACVGIISTATGTIIAHVIPAEYRGFGVSIFSMSTALALALGPFLGITLSTVISYNTLIICTAIAAVCCFAVFLALRDLPAVSKKHRELLKLYSYVDPRVMKFSLVALIICFGYGCIQAFMITFAHERNLHEAASFYFLFYAAATLLSRPVTGRLFDMYGENKVLPPIFAITVIAFVILAFSYSSPLLLLSGFILGIGFGNFQSVGQAVSLSMVTPSRFAQATTTFFVFFDFGIGIGPYLFGFLIPPFGYEGLFLALAATTLFSAVLYYFIYGKNLHFE